MASIMKTRKQLAAEAGVTEDTLDAVQEVLNDLDPAKRAELIKAISELRRIAKENNMTLDEFFQGATKFRQ